MGRRGGGGALRALDAFPKIADDFAARTASGGAVTLGALCVMGLLFVGELGAGTGWWRDGRWGRRAAQPKEGVAGTWHAGAAQALIRGRRGSYRDRGQNRC